MYYLASRNSAAEINAFNPESRAIIMLRNPIELLYSLYHQVRSNLQENLDSFEAALQAEERRRQGLELPPGATKPQQLMYRDTVSFNAQVGRFFSCLGRERVLVLLHDDFEAHPLETYRSVLRFLGVDDRFEPVMGRVNASHTYRSERVQRFVTHPPAWLEAASRRLLPQRLLRHAVAYARSANAQPMKRNPMPSHLRRSLAVEMRPDVERLSALLDRDLMHWVEPRAI